MRMRGILAIALLGVVVSRGQSGAGEGPPAGEAFHSQPPATVGAARDMASPSPAVLVGRWVQDEAGPVQTMRKVFTFGSDGTYSYVLIARPPESMSEHVLTEEKGRYSVQADQLALRPASRAARTYRLEMPHDPVLGHP